MQVRNPGLAGSTATLPNQEYAVFDAQGYAEVSDGCGLFGLDGSPRVPGFSLVSGTPQAIVTAEGEIRRQDGSGVVCIGPPEMAGQQAACPDGRTVACFDLHRRATVPSTCGLDQVPGYRFLNPEDAQDRALMEAALAATAAVPVQVLEEFRPPDLEYVRRPPGVKPPEVPRPQIPQPPALQTPRTQELPLAQGGYRQNPAGPSQAERSLPTPQPRPGGADGSDALLGAVDEEGAPLVQDVPLVKDLQAAAAGLPETLAEVAGLAAALAQPAAETPAEGAAEAYAEPPALPGKAGRLTDEHRAQIDAWLAAEPTVSSAELVRRSGDQGFTKSSEPVYDYARHARERLLSPAAGAAPAATAEPAPATAATAATAAAAEVATELPAGQAALLEGAAAAGEMVCPHCGRNDFRLRQTYHAHLSAHERGLPAANIGGAGPEPAAAAAAG